MSPIWRMGLGRLRDDGGVQDAIAAEVASLIFVGDLAPDERVTVLRSSATRLGKHVLRRLVNIDHVIERLYSAGLAVGLERVETYAAVRSGLLDGLGVALPRD